MPFGAMLMLTNGGVILFVNTVCRGQSSSSHNQLEQSSMGDDFVLRQDGAGLES